MDETGLAGELAMSFNFLLDLLQRSTDEMHRVSEVVGTEGKIGQRATLPGATGGWAIRIESLNKLISDLVGPTAEVSRVIGAVAKGDLSQRMEPKSDGVALQGEFLRLGNTVNRMVDQLGSFASEVTRVAREVGSEGKLGG
jgi:methyl-accepting chemotaxis protein